MTFRHSILAVSALLFAALFLVSCSKSPQDTETTSESEIVTPDWSQAQVITAVPTTAAPSGEKDDSADSSDADNAAGIDANEVKEILTQAMQVYSLFSSSIPPIDRNESFEYEEGLLYYKVTDGQIDTLTKLRKYISGFFSGEICDLLINIGRYIEQDGSLYVLDISMPSDSSVVSESFDVKSASDEMQVFSATVGRDTNGDGKEDSTEQYDFVREKADGKWIFTKFPYYK